MKDPNTCFVRQEAIDCSIRDNKPVAQGSVIILQWMFNLCVIFNNLKTSKAGIQHGVYSPGFCMGRRRISRELDLLIRPVVSDIADISLDRYLSEYNSEEM